MKITRRKNAARTAAVVVDALRKNGIEAVLTGGAVVSIYTHNRYVSRDIDLIAAGNSSRIEAVMLKLGFEREGKDFVHRDTEFTIEFPSGPLSLGAKVGIIPEGKETVDGVVLRLLSPAQSVMDRLAAYYHWNDPQSLEQAVAVCLSQKVDLKIIQRWSIAEGEGKKLKKFETALKMAARSGGKASARLTYPK